jgi:hypothetical protein
MRLWRRRKRRHLDPALPKLWKEARKEESVHIHELIEREKEEERELYRKFHGEDFPMARVHEARRWTFTLDAGDIAVVLVLIVIGCILLI